MTCRNMKSYLEPMLLAPEQAPQAAHDHLAACASCRGELAALQATFALLDDWQAPKENAHFPARMQTLLREEKHKGRAGWMERLHMRMLLGHRPLQPVAALALALLLLIGGGTYAGIEAFTSPSHVTTPQSATLRDLQSLDQNAQVFQQLNVLEEYGNSGNSSSAGSM